MSKHSFINVIERSVRVIWYSNSQNVRTTMGNILQFLH